MGQDSARPFADVLLLASRVSILMPGSAIVSYVELAAKRCSRILPIFNS